MSTPPGPTCAACAAPAVVHWQRRITDTEIAAQQAIEAERRKEVVLLSDPDGPPPVFPAMPDFLDATTAIYACVAHAVTLDQAALIHAKNCAAPPTCTCKPEPAIDPDPEPEPAALPPGW